MKKIIYLSGVALTLMVQGVAFAETEKISQKDFQQIVCSYMKDIGNKQEALTKVFADTGAFLTSQQKETLKKLATEQLNSQSYCRGFSS
ncbi:hypothetical protein [Stanieria cyanosphaera]|nr:hypothetical protein [Stanieria cyanosphaera]